MEAVNACVVEYGLKVNEKKSNMVCINGDVVNGWFLPGCLTGSWSVWSHVVTLHSTIYHILFVIYTVVKIWSTRAVQNRNDHDD